MVQSPCGIATYNNWKKISGHYPKINRGAITWDYMENSTSLPNTHQPYIAYRFRYRLNEGTRVVGNDVIRGVRRADDLINRPSEWGVQKLPEEFNQKVGIPPRRLDVLLKSVDIGGGHLRLQVTGVEPDSSAQRAGLETGDVIVQVDGQRVQYQPELVEALSRSNGSLVLLILSVRNRQFVQVAASIE